MRAGQPAFGDRLDRPGEGRLGRRAQAHETYVASRDEGGAGRGYVEQAGAEEHVEAGGLGPQDRRRAVLGHSRAPGASRTALAPVAAAAATTSSMPPWTGTPCSRPLPGRRRRRCRRTPPRPATARWVRGRARSSSRRTSSPSPASATRTTLVAGGDEQRAGGGAAPPAASTTVRASSCADVTGGSNAASAVQHTSPAPTPAGARRGGLRSGGIGPGTGGAESRAPERATRSTPVDAGRSRPSRPGGWRGTRITATVTRTSPSHEPAGPDRNGTGSWAARTTECVAVTPTGSDAGGAARPRRPWALPPLVAPRVSTMPTPPLLDLGPADRRRIQMVRKNLRDADGAGHASYGARVVRVLARADRTLSRPAGARPPGSPGRRRPAARRPRAWPGSTSPGCAPSPRRPRSRRRCRATVCPSISSPRTTSSRGVSRASRCLEGAALLGPARASRRSGASRSSTSITGKPWLIRRTVERISLRGWDLLSTLRAPLRRALAPARPVGGRGHHDDVDPGRTIGVISRTPSPSRPRSRSSSTMRGRSRRRSRAASGRPPVSGDRHAAHVVPLEVERELERLGEQRVVLDDQDLELAARRGWVTHGLLDRRQTEDERRPVVPVDESQLPAEVVLSSRATPGRSPRPSTDAPCPPQSKIRCRRRGRCRGRCR